MGQNVIDLLRKLEILKRLRSIYPTLAPTRCLEMGGRNLKSGKIFAEGGEFLNRDQVQIQPRPGPTHPDLQYLNPRGALLRDRAIADLL